MSKQTMKLLALPLLLLLALPAMVHAQSAITTNSGLAAHLSQLRTNVPQGFTIVTQLPFVVIGDEAPEVVQKRATNTVKWAVDKLKLDYFTQDPAGIIDIWLFRDGTSYTNHARQMFHETPFSHFGYFSARNHALIMNISTGTGTLVHEIVHPFLAANFPRCPAWFNEGLASLYEASSEKNGHITGRINWRFKGLERDIKEGRTIPFQQLTAMTDGEFYGVASGATYNQYYAQSRYLCYYLQEKGLLVKFYHAFVSNAKGDPTGFDTLRHVLGETDMEAFRKKWEKFVLELRTQ